MNLNPPILECCDHNLYIRWTEGGKKIDNMLFVAENNEHGKLFQVEAPLEFLMLFPKITQIPSSKLTYLILCQSGYLYMVLLTTGIGHILYLCSLRGNIIWCDYIKVSGNVCLATCDRTGTMYFGQLLKDKPLSFLWNSCNLEVSPITFLKVDENVLFSDGSSTYFSSFEFKNKDVNVKKKRLKYLGIVNLSLYKNTVRLTVCDGRIYMKSIEELLNEKIESETERDYKSIMLPSILNSLQINSDIINVNTDRISSLNLYLEQINIAKSLLIKCPRNIFSVKIQLEASLEKENHILIIICINMISDNIKFDYNWWQIKASLYETEEENSFVVCPKLHDKTILKIPFTVNIKSIKSIINDRSVMKLNIFMSLLHFGSREPICSINIYENIFDVINLISNDCISYNSMQSDLYFNKVVSPKTNNNYIRKNIFKCNLITDINRLLSSCGCFDDENVANGHQQLWIIDIPVKFLLKRLDNNRVHVTIETSDHVLLISLRFSLQVRLSSPAISLNDDLVREAHFCKRVIDVETCNGEDFLVINKLYEFIDNFLSKIIV